MRPESHTPNQSGSVTILGVLWSISWRLWLLLPLLIGALIFGFLDHWWLVLACLIGFIAVVVVMRRFWPPPESHDTSDQESVTFL
jgi:membrane protein YdbS with pleckstrin-like domain